MNTCSNTTTAAAAAIADMTDEEFAATSFEPLTHSPDEWVPPTDEEWARLANPHLVMIRIGWKVMFRTKAKLVETADGMHKADILISTVERLEETGEWLQGLHAIVAGDHARLLCAAAVVATREVAS